jgi:hypothetical protein
LTDIDITSSVFTGGTIRGEEVALRLIPPKVRTNMYQRGFLYRSIQSWNGVPTAIKIAEDNMFVTLLKNYCSNVAL